jgi:hypothetical protein
MGTTITIKGLTVKGRQVLGHTTDATELAFVSNRGEEGWDVLMREAPQHGPGAMILVFDRVWSKKTAQSLADRINDAAAHYYGH